MTADATTDAPSERRIPRTTWAEFLVDVPPNTPMEVTGLAQKVGANVLVMERPDLVLHCSHERCRGERIFRAPGEPPWLSSAEYKDLFLKYVCRNCGQTEKLFSLSVWCKDTADLGLAVKLGERPPFGPPTPARVISLIGPDREIFLKGRRAENLGLGVGAFAYYRRVVENQKNRIIDEIVRVAKRLETAPDVIDQLERAKAETRFTASIDEIKPAIPSMLLINGQNPLTLLHSALSEGLHAQDDAQCLELAQAIRVVLTELADRIGQAMKDHAELAHAVARLQRPRSTD